MAWTKSQLRSAAERCLADPASENDAITARSLIESLDQGGDLGSAENIEAADRWHNKPDGLLPQFMATYGSAGALEIDRCNT